MELEILRFTSNIVFARRSRGNPTKLKDKMKLDLDYIKQILQTIEDSNSDYVKLSSLLEKFKVDQNSQEEIAKLRKHLMDLKDLDCVKSDSESLGFRESVSGNYVRISLAPGVRIALKFEGHKLLDAMRNDTLWNKIKSNLQVISLETLKTLPALAIQLLLTTK